MTSQDYANPHGHDPVLIRRLGVLVLGLRPSIARFVEIETGSGAVDLLTNDGRAAWRFGLRSIGIRATGPIVSAERRGDGGPCSSGSPTLADFCAAEVVADERRWQTVRAWLTTLSVALSGPPTEAPLAATVHQTWCSNLETLATRAGAIVSDGDVEFARLLGLDLRRRGAAAAADRLDRLSEAWSRSEADNHGPVEPLVSATYRPLLVDAVAAVSRVHVST